MGNFSLRLELALAQGTALAILSTISCGGTAHNDAGSSGAGASSSPQTTLATAGSDAAAGGHPAIAGAPGGSLAVGGSVQTNGGASVGGNDLPIAGAAGDPALPSLDPYPVAALGCSGESHNEEFGYHGQCCAKAYCYTPSDGVCVEPEAAESALGLGYGSGECLCGPKGITGPYAPNATDTPASAGACCYLITAIGCDGRPLLVDGRALTSELEWRADWIDQGLFELLRA